MASLQSRNQGNNRRGRRTIAEINMVPFIDVMLVLLIIFMVTAPLITPSLIDLPSVGRAAQQPDKVVQVVIGPDDSVSITGVGSATRERIENLDQLVARTQKAFQGQSNIAVVISADKQVKYETVVRVLDTLQRGGLPRVGLSVQLAP